jgi:hypothetical protein
LISLSSVLCPIRPGSTQWIRDWSRHVRCGTPGVRTRQESQVPLPLVYSDVAATSSVPDRLGPYVGGFFTRTYFESKQKLESSFDLLNSKCEPTVPSSKPQSSIGVSTSHNILRAPASKIHPIILTQPVRLLQFSSINRMLSLNVLVMPFRHWDQPFYILRSSPTRANVLLSTSADFPTANAECV